MAKRKIIIRTRRVSYRGLDGNFTQIANTMFKYIPNGNDFKVYCYLCYRFNRDLDYAFPSLRTISKETCLNVKTVQKSIKWLEGQGLIKRYKKEGKNNNYSIQYIEEKLEKTNLSTDEIIESFKNDEGWQIQIMEIDEPKKEHKRKIDYAYKKWREKVLRRDSYICQLCGKTEDEAILNVHHIKRYSENEELRTEVDNGITLCCDCHRKIFDKEKEFEDYFKGIIKIKKILDNNIKI